MIRKVNNILFGCQYSIDRQKREGEHFQFPLCLPFSLLARVNLVTGVQHNDIGNLVLGAKA